MREDEVLIFFVISPHYVVLQNVITPYFIIIVIMIESCGCTCIMGYSACIALYWEEKVRPCSCHSYIPFCDINLDQSEVMLYYVNMK